MHTSLNQAVILNVRFLHLPPPNNHILGDEILVDVLLNDKTTDGSALDPNTLSIVMGTTDRNTIVAVDHAQIKYSPYRHFFGLDSFVYKGTPTPLLSV